MNLEQEIVLRLKKIKLEELNEYTRKDLIEILELIDNKMLLDAFINYEHTIINLANISGKELLNSRFLDKLYPYLILNKTNYNSKIIEFINQSFSLENLLTRFPNLKDIIKNATFNQMNNFMTGIDSDKLSQDTRFYNFILSKSQNDNRFLSFLPLDKRIINLGILKNRLLAGNIDYGSTDLEICKKVIAMIDSNYPNEVSSLIFSLNYSDNNELKKIILKNNYILNSFINSYLFKDAMELFSDDLLSIIANSEEVITNLSIDKKISLISLINNQKIKIDMIEKYRILENIPLHYSSEIKKFLNTIDDKNYITNKIIELKLYLYIDIYYMGDIIKTLGKNNQYKLLENSKFIEYFKTLKFYAQKSLILKCDVEIINKFYDRILYFDPIDIYDLCCVIPTKENIEKLKEILKSKFHLYTLRCILDSEKNLLGNLSDDDFMFFLNLYPTECESTLINNYDSSQEDEKLKKRIELINKKIIDSYINSLINKADRNIDFFNLDNLKFFNKQQLEVVLNHFSLRELFHNLTSNEVILDYFMNLLETNYKEIAEYKNYSYNNNFCSNLSPQYLDKLIKLYFKLPDDIRVKMLNEKMLENTKFLNYILSDFSNNYLKYIQNSSLFYFILNKIPKTEKIRILKEIDALLLCNLMANIYSQDNDLDFIILERKKEILNLLKRVEKSFNVIQRMLDTGIPLAEILDYIDSDTLFNLYLYDTNNHYQKDIIMVLKNNKEIILKYKYLSEFFTKISVNEINEITSNFDITDMLELFIKTKNINLEDKIMQEFNKTPYFNNKSDKQIEQIISLLSKKNQEIIFSKIELQFKQLNLPNHFLEKIKNISLDDKMFLIYMYNKKIMTPEKIKYIENLLIQNPFALKSLLPNLFEDEFFATNKNLISTIYRYKNLTIMYMDFIKQNNIKSEIIKAFIKLWQVQEVDYKILIIKLNAVINFIMDSENLCLNQLNVNLEDKNQVLQLEKFIIYNTCNFTFLGKSFVNGLNLINSSSGKQLSTIYKEYYDNLKEKLKSNDLNEIKNCVTNIIFGIDFSVVEKLIKKYDTSFSKIRNNLKNNTINIFYFLKTIVDCEEKNLLFALEKNFKGKFNLDNLINMNFELEQAYNSKITNQIKGYKNGKKIKKNISINGQTTEIEVIEVLDNFEIFAHSTDAYGQMEMINNNYYDSWNFSENVQNDGICTAYISDINLGTAAVKNLGVMFGFTKLSSDSIRTMAPYDLVSKNNDIQALSNNDAMYMDLEDLSSYIRHTHSETVLKRRNNSTTGSIIQPDCIIIYEEMSDEIKANAVKAQKDFLEYGIDVPIVYINRHKIVENQSNKLVSMLDKYEKYFDLKLLSEILNNYESLRCGLVFDNNIDIAQVLPKKRIYNDILKTIEILQESNEYVLIQEFIRIMEYENSKFNLIPGDFEGKAKFDLCDDKIVQGIEQLKRIIQKQIK